ncbi:MAG: polyphenol oxidase family protein [Patescibacteria group bacterium]|jgi:hypothetical protein
MPDIFSSLRQYAIIVDVSTKADGNMRLLDEPENDTAVWKNREVFLKRHGIARTQLVRPEMRHTGNVAVVGAQHSGERISNTDGLLTNEQGVFLMVTMADCLPVFLYDPEQHACGLIHAGWRGLDADIVTTGVVLMQRAFGTKPQDIRMVVGPGIGVDHYDVEDERAKVFQHYRGAVEKRNAKQYLNLSHVAHQQAERVGVRGEHIRIDSTCTACARDMYFSSRRDRPAPLQTQMALMGMPLST